MILLFLSLFFGLPQEKPAYPVIPCEVVGQKGDLVLVNCREAQGPFGLQIPEARWPGRWGVHKDKGTKVVLTEKNGELVPWYRVSPDCAQSDTCCLETRTPTNVTIPDPR